MGGYFDDPTRGIGPRTQSTFQRCLVAKGVPMPIRPFLPNHAFDLEVISAMSLALERACDALRLKVIDDIATRMVAEKIIKMAQQGIKDPDTLASMVLKDFET